ncbi:MAG: adenylyltransferase/cytidyltransferase family protein [bacterium]|nr:adenylyltransferase/cytidyltransferase family protein [bacterium]
MEKEIQKKILLMDDLLEVTNKLKEEKKVIVQSHGVFDLIHPGIIKHLNSAKSQGDILVVTIIKDQHVRRGPGRPVFPEKMRAENVASLAYVDYVCIVDDDNPFKCIKTIQPDIFAKGQDHIERNQELHVKIFEQERDLYFGKSEIFETGGFTFSGTEIINKFLNLFPPETKSFLDKFSAKYDIDDINENLNKLKDLKILLIGDGIIDEYHYCDSMSKSAKTPIVVHKYNSHEVFAGGAFAIANHVSEICNNVHLVSLLGSEDSREGFVTGALNPKVKSKFFYRHDGPTVIKKRYINQYLNQKLFEVNYLNNSYIDESIENEIISYLKKEIPQYDLVLVADFGHNLISKNIIKVIESTAKKYAVNTQTNAANSGFNMITRYNKPAFVCLDEQEVRWASQDRYSKIEDIAHTISREINCDNFIVTLGKNGAYGISSNGETSKVPILSTKVLDTVGAGDAFFSYTAPCIAMNMPIDFVTFLGNAVGALAVQIIGNKKPVEKYELIEFINAILK